MQKQRLSPPKVPLTLRIGVVGHRPNRLKEADKQKLADVLKEILSAAKDAAICVSQSHKEFFKEGPPVLRAVSPLAEGTDRHFAWQALDLGYELCCIMPFKQAEFEKDFMPGKALCDNSLEEFRDLLQRAKESLTQFEINGERDSTINPYGTAGRFVLKQSDVLVVVWDGLFQGKSGGTEETFRQAVVQGIPVICVDARAPHSYQMVTGVGDLKVEELADGGQPESEQKEKKALKRHYPDGSGNPEQIKQGIKDILVLPAPGKEGNRAKKTCRTFLKEKKPGKNTYVMWRIFKDIWGDMKIPRVRPTSIPPFETSVLKEWPDQKTTPHDRMIDTLRPFYAWPDKLAVIYSERYRSTYLISFLLAALAVGFALAPISFQVHSTVGEGIFTLMEMSIILYILYRVFYGRWKRWHERWIDYRLVAELVRHLRLVSSVGGGRAFVQVPAHLATYGSPGTSWMAWYVKALERSVGLPNTIVTRKYIRETVNNFISLVTGQAKWHQDNAERCHRMERRLHKTGMAALFLTLVACFLHLLPGAADMVALICQNFSIPYAHPNWFEHLVEVLHNKFLPGILTVLCGFLPALGAAVAGIINQGEFTRIEKRSRSMAERLYQVKGQLEKLKIRLEACPGNSEALLFIEAESLAVQTADLMLYEVLDWRVVFMDKVLNPPA